MLSRDWIIDFVAKLKWLVSPTERIRSQSDGAKWLFAVFHWNHGTAMHCIAFFFWWQNKNLKHNSSEICLFKHSYICYEFLKNFLCDFWPQSLLSLFLLIFQNRIEKLWIYLFRLRLIQTGNRRIRAEKKKKGRMAYIQWPSIIISLLLAVYLRFTSIISFYFQCLQQQKLFFWEIIITEPIIIIIIILIDQNLFQHQLEKNRNRSYLFLASFSLYSSRLRWENVEISVTLNRIKWTRWRCTVVRRIENNHIRFRVGWNLNPWTNLGIHDYHSMNCDLDISERQSSHF